MQLTRFKAGSIRELFAISFPLMMSSLSMMAMIFVDRVFLARYNLAAMSAAVTAGTAAWSLLGSLAILAGMAEVLVAQFNGSKQHHRLGEPVWQMFWFSCATTILFIPMAFLGGEIFFFGSPLRDFEEIYFRWLNYFGPVFVAQSAISAYFIGRGRPGIVTWLAIGGNLLNALLDWLFIFGVEGWFEPMGLRGAAIATSLGSLFQLIFLFCLFQRKKERETYGTFRYRLNWPVMRTCLGVGVAMAGMFFIEISGWAFFYKMIGLAGAEQVILAGICQSITILFMFISEGIGRGASTIVGNYIGSKQSSKAYQVFRAGLKLHLIFFLVMSILFFVFPQVLVDLFIGGKSSLQQAMLNINLLPDQIAGLESTLTTLLQLTLFFLLFEGVRYLISGMLTAAGDTIFILVAGSFSVVSFLIIPTFLSVHLFHQGVVAAFVISIIFLFLIATIFLARFYWGPWQKIDLLSRSESVQGAVEPNSR